MSTSSERPDADSTSSDGTTESATTIAIGEKLDKHFRELFGGPPEHLAHDLHLEEIHILRRLDRATVAGTITSWAEEKTPR